MEILAKLLKTACFGVLGGLLGFLLWGALSLAIGWLLGLPPKKFGEDSLIGVGLGAATGLILSEPLSDCRALQWLQSLSVWLGSFWRRLQSRCVRSTQPTSRPVVLFLCSGNSARSIMAEALLKWYAGDRFEVHSAGLRPKGVHPLTTRVMSEAGIDVSTQQSKGLRDFLGRLPVRVAITVCAPTQADCPTNWPGARTFLSWPFEDPAACEGSDEERLRKFRQIRDEVDGKIRSWLQEIGVGDALVGLG